MDDTNDDIYIACSQQLKQFNAMIRGSSMIIDRGRREADDSPGVYTWIYTGEVEGGLFNGIRRGGEEID